MLIIHGSHRHGHSWEIASSLSTQLISHDIDVSIIDLSVADINCCCGLQVCQEAECIYKQDDFSEKYKDLIIKADGIFIITPTYFNMPPAKLKNFIDRTNALLPLLENNEKHPFFGAYICGEADYESINCNLNLLKEYAAIMGWNNVEQLNITEYLVDTAEINNDKIKNISDLIIKELQLEGE